MGDAVLREAARWIRGALRISDTVGRYGGEEFVVLLPETNGEQAVATADKLRARLAARPVTVGATSIAIRVSIGAAAWSDEMHGVADLYAAADQALYRAKALGRDRTHLHDPDDAVAAHDAGPQPSSS